jgi:hypothetical protein
MRVTSLAALITSASLSFSMASAEDASASVTRYFHGSECSSSKLASVTYSGGQTQNGSANDVDLICPVLYGTDFAVSSTSTITVDGYQHSLTSCLFGDITVKVCKTPAGGASGSCGTGKNPGVCGTSYALTPAPTVWTSTGDYYYIDVDLPAQVSGSDDVLYGYTVTT